VRTQFARQYLTSLRQCIETVDLSLVDRAIEWFRETRDAGGQIFVCGNGGSAMTASHLVTEVVKSASYNRAHRFRILCLADSISTITAYSNDLSYDCVFEEQLKNFARPGDLVMGLSGSGNSPNVVRAIEYGNAAGCRTLALTGRGGGKLGQAAQLEIRVAETHQGRIEDVQMAICHILSYYFIECDLS
jgi:D-sedoheptulose 7-phosphate isomerase